MEYCIGVDAGGTATTAAVFGWETGALLGKGRSGFGNPLNGYDDAMRHIHEAVAAALAAMQMVIESPHGSPDEAAEGSPDGSTNGSKDGSAEGTSVCRHMFAGIAGASASGLRERLAADLAKQYGCPVTVDTDARLALEGALKGGDGILLIAGTGSVAQGRRGGQLEMAGGWGNLVGDEGSGYDLVRRAVRLMTRDADEGMPERPLSRAVRAHFGAANPREVIGYLHGHNKADIAAASPVIEKVAIEGDPDAMRFLEEMGDELARLVIVLARRLALPPGFPLALQGSVVRKVAPVRERMLEAIRTAGLACSLLPPEDELTRGAWYYARALDQGGDTQTDRENPMGPTS